VTPLEVAVVIARYQGEKKLSSLPYTLSVNCRSQPPANALRMGGAVPMPSHDAADDTGSEAYCRAAWRSRFSMWR
jgi:hypothetical protein